MDSPSLCKVLDCHLFDGEKNTMERGSLLERLKKGVLLGAEGYLFELERRGYL